VTTVYQRWEDLWQWLLCSLLFGSVWLFPVVLAAQPFDVEPLRASVVRVLGNRGNNIGSGSLIKVEGRTGYILTAYHVIQRDLDQDNPSVKVELYTGQVLDAGIFRNRVDYRNDIAMLVIDQLPEPPPPVIRWESATTVRELQRVYALGHPSREIRWPITEGTVNGKQSGKIYFSGNAVHPGNSGGPLLNDQGTPVAMILTKEGDVFGTALTWDVIQPLIEGWMPGPSTPVPPRPTPPTISPPPPTALRVPATTRRGKDGKDMLLVPEGWFIMGSTEAEIQAAYELGKKYDAHTSASWFADEKPQHRVWVDAFYMDKYEVTLGEYKAFLRATGYKGLPEAVARYAPKDTHPVVLVSWDDAEAYCRWAGKQLPTEAQWEKAARGSDGLRYPWGNEAVDGKRANYCDTRCDYPWKDKSQEDGYQYTAPVGSYPLGKSPYGIEDLAGNVWEWVQDWYDAEYYRKSPERNPVNTKRGIDRVRRGGGWRDNPVNVRAANRFGYAPDDRRPYPGGTGFRCVVVDALSRP
jgi:formylglycine-generating enzyme required for sulfatase activity